MLAPPESYLHARKSGKVSDFIPPKGRRGLVKRGSPNFRRIYIGTKND